MTSFGRLRKQLAWYASYAAMVAGFVVMTPTAARSQCPFPCDAGCYFVTCGTVYALMYSMPASCNGFPFCDIGECVTLSPGIHDLCNVACEYGMWGVCAWREA